MLDTCSILMYHSKGNISFLKKPLKVFPGGRGRLRRRGHPPLNWSPGCSESSHTMSSEPPVQNQEGAAAPPAAKREWKVRSNIAVVFELVRVREFHKCRLNCAVCSPVPRGWRSRPQRWSEKSLERVSGGELLVPRYVLRVRFFTVGDLGVLLKVCCVIPLC